MMAKTVTPRLEVRWTPSFTLDLDLETPYAGLVLDRRQFTIRVLD